MFPSFFPFFLFSFFFFLLLPPPLLLLLLLLLLLGEFAPSSVLSAAIVPLPSLAFGGVRVCFVL